MRIMDNPKPTFMGVFKDILPEYIAYKQAQGYKFHRAIRGLENFDRFTVEIGLNDIQLPKSVANQWCELREDEAPRNREARVSILRQFAIYLQEIGVESYIPKQLTGATSAFVPYIFTDEELGNIFATIDRIKPNPISNADIVYPILFRILYGCGLRVSEAINLRIEDVDLKKGTLRIMKSKFEKDRIVPMSDSLWSIVAAYSEKYHSVSSVDDYFFTMKTGKNLNAHTVSLRFRGILWKSGISHGGRGKGPRLHDIRHTFSVYSLKQQVDNGVDIYTSLPILSTYLGHDSISSTEKYVRLVEAMFSDLVKQVETVTDYVFPEVYSNEAY